MKYISVIFGALIFVVLPFFSVNAAELAAQSPVIDLKIGRATVKAEVAKTEDQRSQGLMFRKQLGKNSGMLFDFGAPAQVCMWMKNTYIPLSVAFIDQDGIITNIEDMTPLTTDSHCSSEWVVYALEMNRGWFASKKIRPGDKVHGIP